MSKRSGSSGRPRRSVTPEGTPVSNLLLPGGVVELEIHPEAGQERSNEAA
ncbi:MAG: hypothetical protein KC457_10995 [Myxococcales bacterium]|nr:hypothetical protein [Myxococcales bacterium]